MNSLKAGPSLAAHPREENPQGTFMIDQSYDAIVIGSGISGGWAAKELAESGLKVLMLERGEKTSST